MDKSQKNAIIIILNNKSLFCKIGNPSVKDHEWKEFNIETGYKMIIGEEIHLEKGYQLDRTKAIIKMFETNPKYKYILTFADILNG